jgi:hypothetical protein
MDFGLHFSAFSGILCKDIYVFYTSIQSFYTWLIYLKD